MAGGEGPGRDVEGMLRALRVARYCCYYCYLLLLLITTTTTTMSSDGVRAQ